MSNNKTANPENVKALFNAGAHFAYTKSRRHPSAAPFIFGAKNNVEIFDLEKTEETLTRAEAFLEKLGSEKKPVVFIASKHEAHESIQKTAEGLNLPFVAGRWIGGTFTNFTEIKKRLAKLEKLRGQRERGELGKYTKKERLMIDREIESLEESFGGLVGLNGMPAAIVVVDSKHEAIAVNEAHHVGVPVVSISGSDCDVSNIEYPIIANDGARASIAYILERLGAAYDRGTKTVAEAK